MELPRTIFKSKQFQHAGSMIHFSISTIYNTDPAPLNTSQYIHSTSRIWFYQSKSPQHQSFLSFFCRTPRVKWESEREPSFHFFSFLSVSKEEKRETCCYHSFHPWAGEEIESQISSILVASLSKGEGELTGCISGLSEKKKICSC